MDIELKQIDGKVIQICSEDFKRKIIEEYLSTGFLKPHQSLKMPLPEIVHQQKLLINRNWGRQKQLSNIVNQ